MRHRLTTEDVSHVANLARLRLTAAELQEFTTQLGDVLDLAAELDGLELGAVDPMAQPYPLTNVVAPDLLGPSLSREEVLAQAPAAQDGRFLVPPVLGEAP